jgi:hypothetical protein
MPQPSQQTPAWDELREPPSALPALSLVLESGAVDTQPRADPGRSKTARAAASAAVGTPISQRFSGDIRDTVALGGRATKRETAC